jgi:uncharacterized lipoprotein YddW (UPF0748 family)
MMPSPPFLERPARTGARGQWYLTGLIAAITFLLGSPQNWSAPVSGASAVPPRPLREFRGAWIATVANLDWPSRPGLSSDQQKAELLAIFDRAVQLKLNVLVLQVRPACDTFYASPFEPWSEFLSGQNGKAPEPFYDPLSFAVEEAHRRGLELHAWFNPFRVRLPNAKSGTAPNHITRAHPDWVRNYGSQLWLDPGIKAVREYCLGVILDVVKRYDIDGVHLDDYFYPYPEKCANGDLLDFPDEPNWRAYATTGGRLTRGDWRRRNIDVFIEALYKRVKAEKRWVKLGVSPFGIWRPGFPKQIKGFDAYEHLYADSRKWLAEGWLDYCTPQLYWDVAGSDHSYPILLSWWVGQNAKARHLWPGNDLTKVGGQWTRNEITKQILLTRHQSGASGNLLWNISSLIRDNGDVAGALSRELYTQAALVPASPWLDETPPAKPRINVEHDKEGKPAKAAWSNTGMEHVWLWVYQTRARGKWTSIILPGQNHASKLPPYKSSGFPDLIAVTAIDRCGRAGTPALVKPETAGQILSTAQP